MDSKIDYNKNEIKDALTCFICTLKVSEPLMCPQCKRMVCQKCIKKWYDEGHDKCPYCQVQSSFENMVSLPFMEQLSQFFMKEIDNNNNKELNKKNKIEDMNKIIDEDEDLSSNNNDVIINNDDNDDDDIKSHTLAKTHFIPGKFKKEEDNKINNNNDDDNQISNIKRGNMCPRHKNEILEYYCLNCNTKHCSKCLLFFSEESKIHNGHKIILIEQKDKFKIDEIKEDINNLSNVVKELEGYKNDIEVETKIIAKKEEFIKILMEELKGFYSKIISDKKCELEIKNQLIKNQLVRIFDVKDNYTETLNNLIEKGDENGFKEFQETIKDYKDISRYKYKNDFNKILNPEFKLYETDFIDIDINKDEEILGKIYFNVDGINKQLEFQLNGQTFNEVLINIQIGLNEGEDKETYHAYLLFHKNNNIVGISIDEKMIMNAILILGKTILRSEMASIMDEEYKCHVKIIIAKFSI